MSRPNRPEVDADKVLEEWTEKMRAARQFMRKRSANKAVLVEVAAQHPLVGGVTPNAEFTARLDCGVRLYQGYKSAGQPVELYVPGSRHVHDGREDEISLSAAGVGYLRAAGLPPNVLHGDDLNDRYKGGAGVYGSADECYVASSYFRDGNFGTLASVVAPAQVTRKTLHYIAFGVYPLCFTAPVIDGFHDIIFEALYKVPNVLAVDSTLQEPTSAAAADLRRQRRPE